MVAIDNNGNGLAVWERFDGANFRVQARTRSASGVLGSVQDLSAAGQNAEEPQVGIDANGKGVAVWASFSGTSKIEAPHPLGGRRARQGADALHLRGRLQSPGRGQRGRRRARRLDAL
jgi:hypothetical protein